MWFVGLLHKTESFIESHVSAFYQVSLTHLPLCLPHRTMCIIIAKKNLLGKIRTGLTGVNKVPSEKRGVYAEEE